MNTNTCLTNKPLVLILFLFFFSYQNILSNNFWYSHLEQYDQEELFITSGNIDALEGYEFIVNALQISSPPEYMSEQQLITLSEKNRDEQIYQLQAANKIAVIYIPNLPPSSAVIQQNEEFTEKGVSSEKHIDSIKNKLDKIKKGLGELNNEEGSPWSVNIFRKIIPSSHGYFQIQIKCSLRQLNEKEFDHLQQKSSRRLEYKFGGYNELYRHKYLIDLKFIKLEDALMEIERLVRAGINDIFIVKI